jgi:hypothetical protein
MSRKRRQTGAHLDSHGVNVDLLVEIIEQSNGLDDHGVDLVGRELELESRHRVTETERHGVQVLLLDASKEGGELLSDTSVEVLSCGVGQDGDRKGLVDGRSWL